MTLLQTLEAARDVIANAKELVRFACFSKNVEKRLAAGMEWTAMCASYNALTAQITRLRSKEIVEEMAYEFSILPSDDPDGYVENEEYAKCALRIITGEEQKP